MKTYSIPFVSNSANFSNWLCFPSKGLSSVTVLNSDPNPRVVDPWARMSLPKLYPNPRSSSALCAAACSPGSNLTGGFIGVRVFVRQMSATASRNHRGGSKESSGPRMGAGKNDVAFDGKNFVSASTNERTASRDDSPMTAASIASAALSLWVLRAAPRFVAVDSSGSFPVPSSILTGFAKRSRTFSAALTFSATADASRRRRARRAARACSASVSLLGGVKSPPGDGE